MNFEETWEEALKRARAEEFGFPHPRYETVLKNFCRVMFETNARQWDAMKWNAIKPADCTCVDAKLRGSCPVHGGGMY